MQIDGMPFYHERSSADPSHLSPEVARWCDESLSKWSVIERLVDSMIQHPHDLRPFIITKSVAYIVFASEADAMLFRLRWMGN